MTVDQLIEALKNIPGYTRVKIKTHVPDLCESSEDGEIGIESAGVHSDDDGFVIRPVEPLYLAAHLANQPQEDVYGPDVYEGSDTDDEDGDDLQKTISKLVVELGSCQKDLIKYLKELNGIKNNVCERMAKSLDESKAEVLALRQEAVDAALQQRADEAKREHEADENVRETT